MSFSAAVICEMNAESTWIDMAAEREKGRAMWLLRSLTLQSVCLKGVGLDRVGVGVLACLAARRTLRLMRRSLDAIVGIRYVLMIYMCFFSFFLSLQYRYSDLIVLQSVRFEKLVKWTQPFVP